MKSEYIEEEWSFKDGADGYTIMEKSESIYLKLTKLRDKLGGQIKRLICSKYWWKDVWEQVWCDNNGFRPFKPYPIQEHMTDGTIKVARFHDSYDVFISDGRDYFDDAKDWVAIVCNEGVGRIIITDFR